MWLYEACPQNEDWSVYILVPQSTIGGSKRERGTPSPFNFLRFHAIFSKHFDKSLVGTPQSGIGEPPVGSSYVPLQDYTQIYFKIFSSDVLTGNISEQFGLLGWRDFTRIAYFLFSIDYLLIEKWHTDIQNRGMCGPQIHWFSQKIIFYMKETKLTPVILHKVQHLSFL